MTEFTQQALDGVEEAIAAIGDGAMVIVVDDADRENEGDLIVAAARATAERIAFMIRHSSGILCAPLTEAQARRLNLDPMVARNDAPLATAFTISVDCKHGLTTGISAQERCTTVRALANNNVGSDDFVRPGHVFPLIARRGGVLMRSGHTEAAVDLARLAGLPPVGVVGELVNDDGTVKRGRDVVAFAREHGLKVISVADLIAYRQARERLVERVGEFSIDTPIGPARAIAYVSQFDAMQHLALIFGSIGGKDSVATRLHREDMTNDVFGERRILNAAYRHFKADGRGILVYLREGATGVPATPLADTAENAAIPNRSARDRDQAWRDIGLGAQILRDLGVTSIRLLATSTRHYVGLPGFGIEIADTIMIDQ
ncbi:MAG: 3,4-dihydroxy-2-butanone-4-phosphate synthase [Hyphomicrobiales bacterium]